MSWVSAIIVLPFLAIVKLFVPNAPPPSAKNIASPVLGVAGNVAVTTFPEVSTAYLTPAVALKLLVFISKSGSASELLPSVLSVTPPAVEPFETLSVLVAVRLR
jgi:hypothetical protein